MLDAALYQTVYLLIVSFLSLFTYSRYITKDGLQEYPVENPLGTIVLVVFMTLFIGFRPLSGRYFVDMMGYHTNYYALFYGRPFEFEWDTKNVIFDNLYHYLGSMCVPIDVLFVTMATLYFVAAYLGIRKMFPDNTWAVYLVFLAAFSTFSYGTNGLKAGVAASLFILALAYRENLLLCITLALLSMGFHHSMKLPVAALALAVVYKNPKVYFYAWVVCLLMSAAHITFFQEFFSSIASDAEGYLDITAEEGGNAKSGFRLDFILYSSMPVLVGYYAVFKKEMQLSKLYTCLLNIYLCTNSVWMLCIYASFTNRIAYLSWFLYPIVLIYPFLNEDWGPNRYRSFAKVMLAHLGFTLFMHFVYYA